MWIGTPNKDYRKLAAGIGLSAILLAGLVMKGPRSAAEPQAVGAHLLGTLERAGTTPAPR